MILCVAADGKVKDTKTLPECDIALFGFKGLGEVDYESELKGKSEKFEDAARLSKSANCGVFAGCRTLSRGLLRKSVAAADRGRLLGISDMIHVYDGEDFKSGAGLGVYCVGGYKVGLCIENDLYFPDAVRALSMCGCNVVCAFIEEIKDVIPPLLIRSYAYLYGVPIVMCAGSMAYFADITGEMATSSQPYSLYEVTPQSKYRLITERVKGLNSDGKADY